MKAWIQWLAAALFAASLVACESTGVKDSWNTMSGYLKADRTEGLQGTLVDAVARPGTAAKPLDRAEVAQGFEEDVRYLRYGNKTRANLPELEGYANQVLKRLQEQWPGPAVAARVYITPSPDFEAYTLEHGAIFVSLGSLQLIDNEDELAALLGHEYSHAALKHHSKDFLQKFSNTAFRFANLYLQSRMQSGHDVQNRARALKVASWVSDKALFPNWNSGQENEADILGTDLLVRAGYNGDAMIAVLKKVQATAQERQKFIAENPIQMKKDDKGRQVLKSIDLDVFARNVMGSLEDKLARQYEEAGERQKRVRDYLKREYRKRARPELRTAAYQAAMADRNTRKRTAQYDYAFEAETYLLEEGGVAKASSVAARSIGGAIGDDPYTRMLMYRIRNFEKQARKADINLQKAYQSGGAPMFTYELLTEQALKRSDYPRAQALLDEMDRLFDGPAEILPNLIRVNRKLGKPVTTYQLRCLASADRELIQRCNEAREA